MKIHSCCECRKLIQIEEVYENFYIIIEEGGVRFKTCLSCVEKRKFLNSCLGDFGEPLVCVGELFYMAKEFGIDLPEAPAAQPPPDV
jgi:hypothetical protein